LHFNFQLTEEQALWYSATHSDSSFCELFAKLNLWYHTHRYLRSPLIIAPVMAASIAVTWSLPVIFDISISCRHDVLNPFSIGNACLLFLLLGAVGIKLKGRFDNLGLKRELKMAAISFISCYGIMGIVHALPSGEGEKSQHPNGAHADDHALDDSAQIEFWVVHILTTISSLLLVIISIFIPLVESFRTRRKPLLPHNSTGEADSVTLNRVLSSRKSLDAFRHFLEAEFSAENVLFYVEVIRFQEDLGLGRCYDERSGQARWSRSRALSLVDWIQQIHSAFIRDDAMLQVNLPGTIRRELLNSIKKLDNIEECQLDELCARIGKTSKALMTAAMDVFRLMEADSFQRFLSQHENYFMEPTT
jgi:hypothetical protein